MDIAGAKALKERLGSKGTDGVPPVSADADVPEDAPPVYHWLRVSQAAPETPPAGADDEEDARGSTSLFRRLGFSFR
jgi:hypothetical protein